MTARGDGFVRYANRGGNAGVVAYRAGDGFLELEFREGWRYRYDEATTGAADVAAMTLLAARGQGLTTFVSQHVRLRYARRWRVATTRKTG